MTLLPGCQGEGESSGEGGGERTGVEPQTERGQQAGQHQRALLLEAETLPVESCDAQSQEHQLRLQMAQLYRDWTIIVSPGGGDGETEVPHRKVLLVTGERFRYQAQLILKTDCRVT